MHIHTLLCMRLKFVCYIVICSDSFFFFYFAMPYNFERRSTISTFVCARRTRFENIATYFGYSPNTIVDSMNKQVTPATWWHRTSLSNEVR